MFTRCTPRSATESLYVTMTPPPRTVTCICQFIKYTKFMITVMNFLYIPYVNHTSVLNSYITNILQFLSIITPEQTFEVRVQLA